MDGKIDTKESDEMWVTLVSVVLFVAIPISVFGYALCKSASKGGDDLSGH